MAQPVKKEAPKAYYRSVKLPWVSKIKAHEVRLNRSAGSKAPNLNLRSEKELAYIEDKLQKDINNKATKIYSKAYLKKTYGIDSKYRTALIKGELCTVYRGIRKGGALGKGAFGKTIIVQKKSGDLLALKVITGTDVQAVKQEAAMLEKVGLGEQIIFHKQRAAGEVGKQKTYMVMPLIPGKPLDSLIDDIRNLAPVRRHDIAKQLLNTLVKLKKLGMVHRDIKVNNIMYDLRTNTMTLIDYGLAIMWKDRHNANIAGTPGHIAPEIFKRGGDNSKFSEATDIYAAGRALQDLFGFHQTVKAPMFNGSDATLQFGEIRTELSSDRKLETLVLSMVDPDPTKRPPLHTVRDPKTGITTKGAIERLDELAEKIEEAHPIKVAVIDLQKYLSYSKSERQSAIADIITKFNEVLFITDGKKPLNAEQLLLVTKKLEEANLIIKPDILIDPTTIDITTYLDDVEGHPYRASLYSLQNIEPLAKTPDKVDYYKQLFLAIEDGNKAAVQSLLESGVTIHSQTPGRYDIGGKALYKAVEKGNIEIARMLLEHGAYANFNHPSKGETPLLCALKHGNEAMASLLLDYNADPRKVSTNGIAPIISAADRGLSTIVERLIAANVDLSVTMPNDKQLLTAYEIAQKKGHQSIVDIFDLNTAKTAIASNDTSALEQLLATGKLKPNQNSLLCYACVKGCSDAVLKILIDAKADIEQNINGHTALMFAVKNDHYDAVKFLIKNGANVNATGRNNINPLYIAAIKGSSRMVSLLLSKNANPNIKAISPEGKEETAAEAARDTGNNDTYQQLIESQRRLLLLKQLKDTLAPHSTRLQERAESLKAIHLTGSNAKKIFCQVMAIKVIDYCLAQPPSPLIAEIQKTAVEVYKTASSLNMHAFDEIIFNAIATNDLNLMRLFLDTHLYNVNEMRNTKGESLLFIAINQNKPDMVKQLLDSGANISQKASDGITSPLLAAAVNNNVDTIKVLIDNGADVMAFLEEMAKKPEGLELTKLLLAAAVNAPTKEKLQLIWQKVITELGHQDVIKLLIQAGISVDEPLANNKSPLYHATKSDNLVVVGLLLNAGAKPNSECLDVAIKNNYFDCADLLGKALHKSLMAEILGLQAKAPNSSLPLQSQAVATLLSLAREQTYDNTLKLLNAYRELEILAKNVIPYKPSFFSNITQPNQALQALQTGAIHKAINTAYSEFCKAGNVNDAVKCVQQLKDTVHNKRETAARNNVNTTLINLLDRSTEEAKMVAKSRK